MPVRMYTMTHKKFDRPEDSIYIPLHVGRALSEDLGYDGDHTGDNISEMNGYYSELSGVYWVWKNVKTTDYVGICHYRRYLISDDNVLLKERDFEAILKGYDIITSKKITLNFSYFEGYSKNHYAKDLIETGKVVEELFPEYYEDYHRIIHSNETYFGNIMVASKEVYDAYAEWLFTILFEVQKRIDISGYDNYHKRVFGFISEILLLVYVTNQKLKVFECKVGMVGEKYETRELKEKLAEFFAKKDITGAKSYFLSYREKRPDVLMEASDTTGELKLSMQVIATCEMEQAETGNSILDEYQQFSDLMKYMQGINAIVKRYQFKHVGESDLQFLLNRNISFYAIAIAVKVMCPEDADAVKVLTAMGNDLINSQKHDLGECLLERSREYDLGK